MKTILFVSAAVMSVVACSSLPRAKEEPRCPAGAQSCVAAVNTPTSAPLTPEFARLRFVDPTTGRAKNFDFRQDADWDRLATDLDALNDLAKDKDAGSKFAARLPKKGTRKAIKKARKLLDSARLAFKVPGHEDDLRTFQELLSAIRSNFEPVVQENYPVGRLPHEAMRTMRARRTSTDAPPATNLQPNGEPIESTFWSARSPEGLDLFHGQGRSAIVDPRNDVAEYDAAKEGYGVHPGFDIKLGGKAYKLRFGDEIHAAPFNARMYWVLGYNTFPTDYFPHINLQYSRDMLLEFNSRKYFALNITMGGFKLFDFNKERIYDPLDYVQGAVLKNGTAVSREQLRTRLYKDAKREQPWVEAANYDEAFEAQIDHLLMKEGFLVDQGETERVGDWDFNELDHPTRRELRASQVVAQWLGNSDVRKDNVRLYLAPDGAGGTKLVHYFADVGSGLGNFENFVRRRGEDVELFHWTASRRGRNGEVEFTHAKLLEDNAAYDQMTADDARWMVGKIAALPEASILEALVASGLSAAECRLALEKLVSSRNQMIADFGLSDRYPHRAANERLNYDPVTTPLVVRTADGRTIEAPTLDFVIVDGHLVKRPAR